MEPQDIEKLDPKTRVPNTLPVMQPGEHVVCTIRRHPIGILAVYGLCTFIMLVTALLAFGLAPGIFSNSSDGQLLIAGTVVFAAVTAACAIFAAISTTVYWGNTWTLTTDSLTQVYQISLFKRHSSQLSMEDVEDVTSEQNGILTRIFNFGLLRVETANERTNFVFPFCPNPNYYAARILSAREAFDQQSRAEENIYRQPAAGPQSQSPPPMPAESAAALPQQQPLPPQRPASPQPEIDSYEVPS